MVMQVKEGKITEFSTEIDLYSSFSVTLREKDSSSVQGYMSKNSTMKQIDFLKRCRLELTKIIDQVETGKIEVPQEIRKWWQFWK